MAEARAWCVCDGCLSVSHADSTRCEVDGVALDPSCNHAAVFNTLAACVGVAGQAARARATARRFWVPKRQGKSASVSQIQTVAVRRGRRVVRAISGGQRLDVS